MLREIERIRQDDPALARRWFQDDFFDLFVWTTPGGSITAFHLCYDRLHGERVLGWSLAKGFVHHGIDDGEATPVKNMTPIFVDDGNLAAARVEREFKRRSARIDPEIAAFVLARIAEAALQFAADNAERQD